MTTAEKATVIFQSGFAFRITNKPVSFDYLWDVRIFWAHMEYNGKDVVQECDIKGFADLDDCLDNCLLYLKNYDKESEDKRLQKLADKINYNNQCARATLGDLPEVTIEDLKGNRNGGENR